MASGVLIRFQPSKVANATKAAVNRALTRVGNEMLREMKQIAGEPFPPASRPFKPPHKRTGEHQTGLYASVTRENKLVFGSDAPHSKFLEFGTKNSGPKLAQRKQIKTVKGRRSVALSLKKGRAGGNWRMAPRPTVYAVLFNKSTRQIKQRWVKAIASAVRSEVRGKVRSR